MEFSYHSKRRQEDRLALHVVLSVCEVNVMANGFLTGGISSPCEYGWENMQGTDKVRFCQQCKLNVYNLSSMNSEEASKIVQEENNLCARISTRPDGTVYTDNCPYRLRSVRNFLRTCAPFALVALAWVFQQSVADAQGLIGEPVGGRFGQSNEVGQLADYGYDSARDISRIATIASFWSALLAGCYNIGKARKKAHTWLLNDASRRVAKLVVIREIWRAIYWIILLPIAVHLLGTWCINIFTGLAGGL